MVFLCSAKSEDNPWSSKYTKFPIPYNAIIPVGPVFVKAPLWAPKTALVWLIPAATNQVVTFVRVLGHFIWDRPEINYHLVSHFSDRTDTWWCHQMKTSSALLALYAGIHRSPVNSPHKGQWRGALMIFFICVWINGWANSREAGDLRCYRAHYDVTVMLVHWWKTECISLMLIYGASITNIFYMRQHHGQVNRYPLLILDVISHPCLIARSV